MALLVCPRLHQGLMGIPLTTLDACNSSDLLECIRSLDLERRDKDGHVVLWFAILSSKVNLDDDSETSYAAKLVKRGSSADAVNPLSGETNNL